MLYATVGLTTICDGPLQQKVWAEAVLKSLSLAIFSEVDAACLYKQKKEIKDCSRFWLTTKNSLQNKGEKPPPKFLLSLTVVAFR